MVFGMKITSRQISLVFLGLCLGLVLAATHGVWAERKPSQQGALPLDDIRSFTEVFGKIKENYVEEVSDKTLLDNAIRGMLTGLDPHSTYLNEEDFKDLRVGTTGEFGGLGIVVGLEENGFVKVVSPIDDTPAFRAGVKAGDIIIKLDDKNVKGMGLDAAVKTMRGKPGTSIVLTIMREGADKPLTFTLVRDKIHVNSVKQRTLAPGYGYVRISQFQERTGAELKSAIKALKKETGDKQLDGLVLDLRNNPGGLLDAAIEVSDTFISKGVIVSVKGRGIGEDLKHSATNKDLTDGTPLVVLVNGGSASASEIVAGALQDHKRGIIMGQRTFGKGSVQTVIPLGNNTAIKLTTARYYTPSGRSIQATGIEPDIKVENLKVSAVADNGFGSVKEADLAGHLANPNGDKTPKADDKGGKTGQKADLAKEDYVLSEALNLLKGLHLMGARAK